MMLIFQILIKHMATISFTFASTDKIQRDCGIHVDDVVSSVNDED
jgi:hypothetical protein